MGFTINRRYNVRDEISGDGSSSRVLLVDDVLRGSRACALKLLRPLTGGDLEGARREFETLRSLRHPLIAEVFDFGRVEEVEGGEPAGSAATRPARPGDLFITFSYIDGLDLRQAFLRLFPASGEGAAPPARPEVDARWKVFIEALAEIAVGLHAIHSRGLVHHDVKPQNLLLVPRGAGAVPERLEVKIIDLELAQPETTPLGRRVRGTLPFVAPEVLSGSFADRRSDLYSLGVSIIWAISGRSPFAGSSVEEVASSIQAGALVPLDALCPGAPPELLLLVGRLLRTRSEERIPDALSLAAELERLWGIPRLGQTRTFRSEIPTVGLERELGLVVGEIEALALGESERVVVLVETEPGGFAEVLQREAEAAARLEGVRFLAGRARVPALHPYGPIAEAVGKLVPLIDLAGPRYARFREPLSLFVPGVLPADGKAEPGREPRCGDPSRARQRFFDGVAEFLLEASAEAPLVLYLGDLDRFDGETLDLIEFIARNAALRRAGDADGLLRGAVETGELEAGARPGGPALPRLLIIAQCGEAAQTAPLFGREAAGEGPRRALAPAGRPGEEPLPPVDRIAALTQPAHLLRLKLRPLEPDRIAEWIQSRTSGLSPSPRLIQKIHEKSRDSRRLLDAIVRRLVRQAAFAVDRDPLSTREEEEAVLSLPDNLQDACLEQLGRFGAADRCLLDLLAVAHAPLSIGLLGRVEERLRGSPAAGPGVLPALPLGGEAEVAARVRRLVDEGFLEVEEAPGGIEASWALEPLREQVYRQLSDETRSHYHRAILEGLLAEAGPRRADALGEDIAFHAQKCGQTGTFVHHALRAAAGYRRAHALEPAARLLEEVLSTLAAAGLPSEELPEHLRRGALRATVLRALGEIYQVRRSFSRALEKYTVLLSLEEGGGGAAERAQVYLRMGEVYAENRDPANALFFLEKCVETLKDEPPGRGLLDGLLALAAFHLGRGQPQRARSAAERGLDVLGRVDAPELRARTLLQLAAIASRQNDHARGLALNREAREELERSGGGEFLAEAVEAVGESHLALGDYEGAIREFTQGVEIARRTSSKHDLALFHNHLGKIHFNRANHFLALEYFHTSLRLRQELGDSRAIANSFNNLGLVFRLRDDLSRAAECYKKSIDIFAHIEDQSGMAAGMSNLADVLEMEGRYNEALEYAFRSLEKRKRFNSKSGVAFSYYRIAKIYLSKGDLDKAMAFAEKSLALRGEIGERMGTAYSQLQIAELLLLSGKLLEAFEQCGRGEKEFEKIQNDLGRMVAREILARILIQMGVLGDAEALLEDTLDQARRGNQQIIVGACLLGLGRIAMEVGRSGDAEAHLGRAEALFRDNKNRREHAETLFERCVLALEEGRHARASEVLEEGYTILETLGIRDLVPRYFLLRGRIESESPGGSPERARKFLERGLVEAREVHLPDLSWQLHFRLGLLLAGRGELAVARGHLSEAEEILRSQFEPLPERFREGFWNTRERAAMRKLAGEIVPGAAAAGGEGSPGGAAATPAPRGRQIDEIRALNKKLISLHEVGQAIISELDLHRLLEKLMDAVLELVSAERGFLILREGEADRIAVARNLDREGVDQPELKISRSICAEVIRTGRPVLCTSALDDERFLDSKSVHDLRLLSILSVPLLHRGEALGAIYLDNRLRRHAFTDEDLGVLTTFSAQAAIAITNARLNEEVHARNRQLEAANRQMEFLYGKLQAEVSERTAELDAAREKLSRRGTEPEGPPRPHRLVGKSKPMREISRILDRVSSRLIPVLIVGESGTGKELIASAIHQQSDRCSQRFISENCAALSETILESELFGHTRGAFTGAVADRKGLFELAHGGTLFLDEVGDMSLAMQKKLLRVLQEGEIRRVGGKETIKIDVRIISASNQNLKALVNAGKFREDLYYRLNGIRVEIPPLRERKEDIPLLVEHFLEQIARESRQPQKSVSPEALRLLLSYDWPGNVRELRHFLERTVLLSTGEVLRERDCLFDPAIFRREGQGAADGLLAGLEKLSLREARDAFLKRYLECAYEDHCRNVSRAARACGISRETFHRLLNKLRCAGRGQRRRRGRRAGED